MTVINVSVKGGYWGDQGSTFELENRQTIHRRIARLINRNGMRKMKELMLELNGAAAGQAASATHKQVAPVEEGGAIDSELGGVRTIETVTDVSRNTASADETQIDSEILAYPLQPTYVANKDLNPRGAPGSVGS